MKKLAFLASAIVLAVGANAATTPVSSFSNALGPMEISQSGNLALFDSSLGILTGATLTVTGGISGDITLTYGAAATGNANIRGTTTSDIGINSSLGAIDALFNGVADISLSYTTGFVDMAPGATFVSATLTDSDSLVLNLGALAALEGVGTFSLSCDSLSGFGTTGGGGFAGGSQNTFGQCGASIVYEYTERTTNVPEPGSLALVGLALAGLGFSARRRAAK
jgi:hypothetical protein